MQYKFVYIFQNFSNHTTTQHTAQHTPFEMPPNMTKSNKIPDIIRTGIFPFSRSLSRLIWFDLFSSVSLGKWEKFFKYFSTLARCVFSAFGLWELTEGFRGPATAVGQMWTEIGCQLGEGNCLRKDLYYSEPKRRRHRFWPEWQKNRSVWASRFEEWKEASFVLGCLAAWVRCSSGFWFRQ